LERRRRIVVVLAIDGTLSNEDDCRESSVKAVVVSCRDMTRMNVLWAALLLAAAAAVTPS